MRKTFRTDNNPVTPNQMLIPLRVASQLFNSWPDDLALGRNGKILDISQFARASGKLRRKIDQPPEAASLQFSIYLFFLFFVQQTTA